MLELERTELRIKLYGEEINLRFPTVKETKKFSSGKGDELDRIIEFLECLGLEKEKSGSMELPHLQKIVEALASQKKS